jgi:molybdopterin molybdotransferase
MILASDARKIILGSVQQLPTVELNFREVLGLVCAESVVADLDAPSFDRSAMDGYAIRWGDIKEASPDNPVKLRVIVEVMAGEPFAGLVGNGEAARIMTGGKIPSEADTVIEQELVKTTGENQILIRQAVARGRNITMAGEDFSKSTVILRRGTVLRPASIGILASAGKPNVKVVRKAHVSCLATGDELIEPSEHITDGKIYNSNAYALEALTRKCGAMPNYIGIACDSENELREKVEEGLKADVLITSGGVSVGKSDLLFDVLEELGVEIKFSKVNIKPGMPFLFGMWRQTPIFGLPGNPVSTIVTFLQFVKPALRKMMGLPLEEGKKYSARMEHEYSKTDGKFHYVRGIATQKNGDTVVRATASQSSGVLSSLVEGNCLILIPEDKKVVRAGESVMIESLE